MKYLIWQEKNFFIGCGKQYVTKESVNEVGIMLSEGLDLNLCTGYHKDSMEVVEKQVL